MKKSGGGSKVRSAHSIIHKLSMFSVYQTSSVFSLIYNFNVEEIRLSVYNDYAEKNQASMVLLNTVSDEMRSLHESYGTQAFRAHDKQEMIGGVLIGVLSELKNMSENEVTKKNAIRKKLINFLTDSWCETDFKA